MSTLRPGHAFTAIPTAGLPFLHSLICFSHLRWNFDFRRPQHLMSRFARERRVIYWEEPELAPEDCEPALGVRECAETGVIVVTPSLPEGIDDSERDAMLRDLLDEFLADERRPLIRWYTTPAMLPFSRDVRAIATIYDCMDEEADSRPAKPELLELADVVFTNGKGQVDFDLPDFYWDAAFAQMSVLVDEAIGSTSPIPTAINGMFGRQGGIDRYGAGRRLQAR